MGEKCGDGGARCLNAGEALADRELVKFPPSGRVGPREPEGTLVPEAVRGGGGRLLNCLGKRFMSR